VAGHIFQARPVWIYTQSNITNIILLLLIYFNPHQYFIYKAFTFSGMAKVWI
jgi:hypothetical protein